MTVVTLKLTKIKQYIFKNFRYRSSKYGDYINTPKDGNSSVEESDGFKQAVAESDPSDYSVAEEDLCIAMVEKMSVFRSCIKCHGKLENGNNKSVIGHCTNCAGSMKLNLCPLNFYSKIVFQKQSGQNVTLNCYTNSMRKLLSIANPVSCIDDMKEKKITEQILNIDRVQVRYHTVQAKILDIDKIDDE